MHFHREQFEGFEINVYALPEDCDPEGQFASGDDELDKEVVRRIRNGDYKWFTAKVTASRDGIELGASYLGCCCYDTEVDLIAERDYFEDMRAEAVDNARAMLAKLAEVQA